MLGISFLFKQSHYRNALPNGLPRIHHPFTILNPGHHLSYNLRSYYCHHHNYYVGYVNLNVFCVSTRATLTNVLLHQHDRTFAPLPTSQTRSISGYSPASTLLHESDIHCSLKPRSKKKTQIPKITSVGQNHANSTTTHLVGDNVPTLSNKTRLAKKDVILDNSSNDISNKKPTHEKHQNIYPTNSSFPRYPEDGKTPNEQKTSNMETTSKERDKNVPASINCSSLSPKGYTKSTRKKEKALNTGRTEQKKVSTTSAPPIAKSTLNIEEIYQKKSPIEHILLRPDTYIGSLLLTQQQQWAYIEKKDHIILTECSYVPGLYKIFDEILVNASDHKQRDPIGMNTIKVNIDPDLGEIKVFNNGSGIPVQIHKTEGIYLPELLLGNLLTGSNFNDNIAKFTGGRNGFGAKLTNIFSREFTVRTLDSQSGKYYEQTWTKNMMERQDPVILEKNHGENFTEIIFKPDLTLFNMKSLQETDILQVMHRRVYDISIFLPNVKIYLNGKLLSSNFKKLYRMFELEAVENLESDKECNIDKMKIGENKPFVLTEVNERWTVGVSTMPIPSQMSQLSFVNAINTLNGGTHVNYIADQICRYVLDKLKRKQNREFVPITTAQIKNHLILFIKCHVENPIFDSQTKEKLMTLPHRFGSTCILDEKFLKEVISRTNILEYVIKQAEHQQRMALSKHISGKKKHKLVGIPKLDDANEAGGPRSKECTLIITEGDSAKTLAVSGLSVVGRDLYGVFPVQGKILNVRDAKSTQLIQNNEIKNLIKALGLNPQHTYKNWEEDSKSLRYGHVMLMADQDPDGSHIKGLFINFIHRFWPELVKRPNFLCEFITPLIKATRHKSVTHKHQGVAGTSNSTGKVEDKSQVFSFFTQAEYLTWKNSITSPQLTNWHIKYYKGLGTNTSAEAREYFSNLVKHVIQFKWDDQCDHLINMAFNRKLAEQRREWLKSYCMTNFVNTSQNVLSLSDFINLELIAFSHHDNRRSIPSVIDGLKPSQRKVLYAAFKRRLYDEIKVAQLAGYVSEQAAYHHGENSLQGTIVNMAQDFVGSNNAPLLVPSGQFGTRLQGGKDAASARYIFTKLSQYARLIFPESDHYLLNYLEDDGLPIEPEYYIPIIPFVLVNGIEGVGTGWSTSIPSFNPLDLIENLFRKFQGKPLLEIMPYFHKFKGPITLYKDYYSTTGVFSYTQNGCIQITELPVGKWTNDYKQFLEMQLKEKKLIKHYNEYHSEDQVFFLITPMEPLISAKNNEKLVIKLLKLEEIVFMRNMTAFDAQNRIRKFTPLSIQEEFYAIRLEYYKQRKTWKIKQLTEIVTRLKNQSRFAQNVISEKLKVFNEPKKSIIEKMEGDGYDKLPMSKESGSPSYSYLLASPLSSLTQESVQSLNKECMVKEKMLEKLEASDVLDLWKHDLLLLKQALLTNGFKPTLK